MDEILWWGVEVDGQGGEEASKKNLSKLQTLVYISIG